MPRRRPDQRGRPPDYWCRAHRQLAYEQRRAGEKHPLAVALVRRDMDVMASKASIERAVVSILQKYGLLPATPKKLPHLKILRDDGPDEPEPSAD
jgi:hypothetical protein